MPIKTIISDEIILQPNWQRLYTYIYGNTPLLIVRGPEHGSLLDTLPNCKTHVFHYFHEPSDLLHFLEHSEDTWILIWPKHAPSFLDSLLHSIKNNF